ncbi:MAG: hypothetical protein QM762_26435 [Chryseolinea sp.]
MELVGLLKFKTKLTQREIETLAEIQHKINRFNTTPDRMQDYLIAVLNLLHRGLQIDHVRFLEEIFFDFYSLRTNTSPNVQRIYNQLSEITNYQEDSLEEQTHLVNLYRNIVSDAFDPYLSLIVATLQFIEGTFTTMQHANLSQAEFNKHEYAYARMKPTNLFDGYNSNVRNAVSHTGSNGVIYEPGRIVFRNIKRGSPPAVKFEIWSNQVLRENILRLLDFIHAIESCIEIVGFDTSDIVKGSVTLFHQFLDKIATKQHRLQMHGHLESQVEQILRQESENYGTKLKALSSILFDEYKKRNMPLHSLAFDNEGKRVRIDVPATVVDTDNDLEIIQKILKLMRYGAVAAPLCKFYYENFVIIETLSEKMNVMSIEASTKDLDDYGREEIGLYDLLHDSKTFLNGQKIDVIVDFNKLEELDYLGLDRRFPRRKR